MIVGPRITKNGKVDGRSGDLSRQAVSRARLTEMATGTNNAVNANAKRQKLAGGSKKEILDNVFTEVENDRRDALHGLLHRHKNGKKKGRKISNQESHGGSSKHVFGSLLQILSIGLAVIQRSIGSVHRYTSGPLRTRRD